MMGKKKNSLLPTQTFDYRCPRDSHFKSVMGIHKDQRASTQKYPQWTFYVSHIFSLFPQEVDFLFIVCFLKSKLPSSSRCWIQLQCVHCWSIPWNFEMSGKLFYILLQRYFEYLALFHSILLEKIQPRE